MSGLDKVMVYGLLLEIIIFNRKTVIDEASYELICKIMFVMTTKVRPNNGQNV